MKETIKCPKCGGSLMKTENAYKCCDRTCDFFVPDEILQKRLSDNQIHDLIIYGRTKVIRGFISNNTKEPFDAILVLKNYKIDFEFIVAEFSPYECPKCGRRLALETSRAVCRHSDDCDYYLSGYCGKKFTLNQIEELLRGNTVTAYGFKSQYGYVFDAEIKLITDKNDTKCGGIKVIKYIRKR